MHNALAERTRKGEVTQAGRRNNCSKDIPKHEERKKIYSAGAQPVPGEEKCHGNILQLSVEENLN